jgi:Protein of unknown function (DUF2442)
MEAMSPRRAKPKPSTAYYPVVVRVRVVGPTSLVVGFDNGVERRVNLAPLLRGSVFVPLRRPDFFRKAFACPEALTVVWPNGADIAPETLYEMPEERVAVRKPAAPKRPRRKSPKR